MIDGLLFAALLIGLVAGGYMVARSPSFWLGFLLVSFNAAKPYLVKLLPHIIKLFRPLDPITQKKLDQARRMGMEWDFHSKRPRDK